MTIGETGGLSPCVRLRQGVMSDETIYSEFPEEVAVRWHREGAERIHLVDLDGAVNGRPVNRDAIRKIVASIVICPSGSWVFPPEIVGHIKKNAK